MTEPIKIVQMINEIGATVIPNKKDLSPEQIADKHLYREVRKMSNRKMSRRIKRLTQSEINIDAAWAIVLDLVFHNTKPVGKLEPYLR